MFSTSQQSNYLDKFAINIECFHCEVHTDGTSMFFCVCAGFESLYNTCLSNSSITDQNNFKQIVKWFVCVGRISHHYFFSVGFSQCKILLWLQTSAAEFSHHEVINTEVRSFQKMHPGQELLLHQSVVPSTYVPSVLPSTFDIVECLVDLKHQGWRFDGSIALRYRLSHISVVKYVIPNILSLICVIIFGPLNWSGHSRQLSAERMYWLTQSWLKSNVSFHYPPPPLSLSL